MSDAIASIAARELRIPFKVSFKHASAERNETDSLWVEVRTAAGRVGYGESCPRSYVTHESVASALAFCREHEEDLRRNVVDLATLRAWMEAHTDDIDRHPAAWCALELALLDAIGQIEQRTVEQMLGLAPLAGHFHYSAVIGDMEPAAFAGMAARYAALGFTDFKIKLSGNRSTDAEKIDALRQLSIDSLRVRADANNLWGSAVEAIGALNGLVESFWAVEEPSAPCDYDGLARIADECRCAVILDESLVRGSQLQRLAGPASRWIVNVRVSKMGGLLRSLDVVRAASALGVGVIVGAQVGETSVLTRAALTVARQAGRSLLAQEGAFGTQLLDRDVVDPPLMFGRGGALDIAQSGDARYGLGLLVRMEE